MTGKKVRSSAGGRQGKQAGGWEGESEDTVVVQLWDRRDREREWDELLV